MFPQLFITSLPKNSKLYIYNYKLGAVVCYSDSTSDKESY